MSGIGSAVASDPERPIRPAEVPNELSLMSDNLERLETAISELKAKLEPVSYQEPAVPIGEKAAESPVQDPRCEVSARLNGYNKRIADIALNITYVRKHVEL